MDISTGSSGNGKTREERRKALYGKCYGCSSLDHTVTSCSSKRAICQWYKKVRHNSAVCMIHYLGQPRSNGPLQPYVICASTIPEASGSMTMSSRSASMATSEDVTAMVQQIAELNKSLMEIRRDFSQECLPRLQSSIPRSTHVSISFLYFVQIV